MRTGVFEVVAHDLRSPLGVIQNLAYLLRAGWNDLPDATKLEHLDRIVDRTSMMDVMRRAHQHQGASFVEIYQNCNIFNDGAFRDFTAKEVRADRTITLEHGKPMIFGKERDRGLRVVSEIMLPPGRYQLRAAAAEEGAGASANVLYDLEVPDFYKQPLTMSGLAITAASAGETGTVRAKDPFNTLLPAPITAAREFTRDDTLALFAVVTAVAFLAPPPWFNTDRHMYERVAGEIIIPYCSDLHCFRPLVPWLLGLVPGPVIIVWKLSHGLMTVMSPPSE